MAAINFDARNHTPAASPDPVPNAWYTAMIVESDLKQAGATAKDPNGQYYAFTYEIIEGPYKARRIFMNYSVVNSNADAVSMAYGDLTSLYIAMGAQNEDIRDTQQLHNRPIEIKVKVTSARNDYDPGNTIARGGYRAVGSGAAVPGGPGTAPVAPAAPVAPPAAPAAPAPVAPAPVAPAAPVAPPAAPAAPAPVAPAPVAPAAPVAPPAAPAAPAPVAPAPVAPTTPPPAVPELTAAPEAPWEQ